MSKEQRSQERGATGTAAVVPKPRTARPGMRGAGDQIVVACETRHVPYRDRGLSMPVR